MRQQRRLWPLTDKPDRRCRQTRTTQPTLADSTQLGSHICGICETRCPTILKLRAAARETWRNSRHIEGLAQQMWWRRRWVGAAAGGLSISVMKHTADWSPNPEISVLAVERQDERWLVSGEVSGVCLCPDCEQPSRTRHGRFRRDLQDLPAQGRPVVIRLSIQRGRCRNALCRRQTFGSRAPRGGRLRRPAYAPRVQPGGVPWPCCRRPTSAPANRAAGSDGQSGHHPAGAQTRAAAGIDTAEGCRDQRLELAEGQHLRHADHGSGAPPGCGPPARSQGGHQLDGSRLIRRSR